MNKVLHIAWRDFVATVATKAFLIGMLVTPAMIGLMVLVFPLLKNQKPPDVHAELAVVDPTGQVIDGVRDHLAPEAFARRSKAFREQVDAAIPEQVKGLADSNPAASEAMDQAMESALGEVPDIRVVRLSGGASLEEEKARLLDGTLQDGGRLALAVVHPDAVAGFEGAYGSYDLYVREKLDDRLVDSLQDALREAIAHARIGAQGLDPDAIEALTEVPRARPTAISADGEREANEVLNVLLPMGFMILLLVSVFTAGQQLMTTTIEEKSSRVVEVVLSAVSPMQLMAGKILGQMAVGFLVLALYSALGITALISFAFLGLLDPMLFFYLVIFYLIAYFVIASLMAAIGSAVNEVREAQSLLLPVMMIVMIPWMLWLPITRDPSSLFSTVASLLPPINSFVMMLRLTSTTPPPTWQVWLSIGIGGLSVWAALWLAAKVFRVGLLMFGKPPNLKTLVRWVRMA